MIWAWRSHSTLSCGSYARQVVTLSAACSRSMMSGMASNYSNSTPLRRTPFRASRKHVAAARQRHLAQQQNYLGHMKMPQGFSYVAGSVHNHGKNIFCPPTAISCQSFLQPREGCPVLLSAERTQTFSPVIQSVEGARHNRKQPMYNPEK